MYDFKYQAFMEKISFPTVEMIDMLFLLIYLRLYGIRRRVALV